MAGLVLWGMVGVVTRGNYPQTSAQTSAGPRLDLVFCCLYVAAMALRVVSGTMSAIYYDDRHPQRASDGPWAQASELSLHLAVIDGQRVQRVSFTNERGWANVNHGSWHVDGVIGRLMITFWCRGGTPRRTSWTPRAGGLWTCDQWPTARFIVWRFAVCAVPRLAMIANCMEQEDRETLIEFIFVNSPRVLYSMHGVAIVE